MNPSLPLIEVNQLSAQIKGLEVLRQIDLQIHAGEIVTVIGPNGAGKSTLAKSIAGLQEPTTGTIQRQPGLTIGYAPQRISIDASIPINGERFLHLARPSKRQLEQAITEVGASHLLEKPVQHLSGGEMQRLLLTRALLKEPQLLILDEPMQGVDLVGQSEFYGLIQRIRDRHQCGILIISHDLHLVMENTDRVICLNQHICCHGHPDSVSQHPEYLQLFGLGEGSHLGIYTHHHDHHHCLDGEVHAGESCDGKHHG